MSQSHRHVTAHNLVNFAQHFEICMCELEISLFFFMNFLSIIIHFMSIFEFVHVFAHFPAQKFHKQNCDGAKNPLLKCLPTTKDYFSRSTAFHFIFYRVMRGN